MAKPTFISLGLGKRAVEIPIIYEDRAVLAIDKPVGWMLVPFSWQNTSRNLQAALTSSIAAGDFWARSRSLKFLRNVHRLDADTTGVLLFAKSIGAVTTYSELFESRKMEKTYLAVARGKPKSDAWKCTLAIAPDPSHFGHMKLDSRDGKEAETDFRVLATRTDEKLGELALIEARPLTGRTHQIRLHLASAGLPIAGDKIYGGRLLGDDEVLALRAIALCYQDPFQKKRIVIRAPAEPFTKAFGFVKPAKV